MGWTLYNFTLKFTDLFASGAILHMQVSFEENSILSFEATSSTDYTLAHVQHVSILVLKGWNFCQVTAASSLAQLNWSDLMLLR